MKLSFISVFINSIVFLVGTLSVFVFLLIYFIKKDRKKLRQAGLTFVATVAIIVTISITEIVVIYLMHR
jgi:hypothetical protein